MYNKAHSLCVFMLEKVERNSCYRHWEEPNNTSVCQVTVTSFLNQQKPDNLPFQPAFSTMDFLNTIYFLRRIRSHNLEDGTLRIPRKFVRKYSKGLLNPVVLQLPNGSEWNVHWAKCENQFFLENGWREFAEECSLAPGHRLLFRYEKGSLFHVLIFDKTSLQIIYPEKKKLEKAKSSTRKKHASKRAGNGRGSFSLRKCPKSGGKRKGKVSNTKKNSGLQRASDFGSENPHFSIVMQASYVNKYNLNVPSNFSKQHMGTKKGYASLWVSRESRTWTIKYHFNLATKQSVLTTGWKSFVSDNKLEVGDVCVFELINSIEMSFDVTISRAREGLSCPQSQAKRADPSEIDRGRIEKRKSEAKGRSSACDADFLEERGRGRGIKCRKLEGLDNMQPIPASYTNEALQSSCNLNNPLFKIIMRPSYVGKTAYLNFPSNFSSQHMGKKGYTSLWASDKLRTWTVKYHSNLATKQSVLTSGWRSFASDNKLKVGDVCVFELINSIEISFNVSISRAGEELNCPLSQAERSDPPEADQGPLRKRNSIKGRSRGLNADVGERSTSRGVKFRKLETVESRQATPASYTNKSLRSSCNFTSKIPSFSVAMSPAYISGRAHLYIPFNFAERYLKLENNNGDATLQLPNGKVWSVEYKCRRRRTVEFCSGWKKFMVDNKLEVGDVCIFQLIGETKITLEVILLRGNTNSASFPSPACDCKANEVEARRTAEIVIDLNCKSSLCCSSPARGSSANEVEPQRSTEIVIYKGCRSNHVPGGSPSHGEGRCKEFRSLSKADERGGLAVNLSSTLSKSKVYKFFEAAGKSIPKNPFFTFSIRTTNMMHNIPNDFIMSYLKDNLYVSLRVGRRIWPVKLVYYPKHSYGRFSAGWPAFVRECNLQIGDVCIFELINKDDTVLKVSILKTPRSD